MMALLVAVLTASSAVAALWPLVQAPRPVAAFQGVMEDGGATPRTTVVRRRQGCRRIPIIVRKPGEVQKGCSSARRKPCTPRRRW
ncbi:MAG: hypothetical protein SFW67_18470 [Myxococcaceae bacterium]|nr:hypothetical protein [Myxococcaceae bacterium]